MTEQEQKAVEELVKVKSVESELIALQAFIITNLPSDVAEDYAFPDSTSRKTIRNVMRIINESNERFMKRVRHSVAIREANNKITELMQPDTWPPQPIGTTYATNRIDGKPLGLQPDKELLEVLRETDKDLCVLESTMLQIEQRDHLAEGMAELVKKWRARNKQAISNYEKTDQMTYSDYVRKDLALEFATRFYQLMTSARVDEYIGARKNVCVNDLFEEFLKTKEDEKI